MKKDAEDLQKGLLKPGMWTRMNASLALEENKKKGKKKRAAKKEGPEKGSVPTVKVQKGKGKGANAAAAPKVGNARQKVSSPWAIFPSESTVLFGI